MKKILRIVFITILISFCLPLFFVSSSEKSFSAATKENDDKSETNEEAKPTTVDLTKIQHGHIKVYDWKGNEITNKVFDALGGDELGMVLFGPDGIPVLQLGGARTQRGRDGSQSAFWFNQCFNNNPPDPACGICKQKNCSADLGDERVFTPEAREEIRKNASSDIDKVKLAAAMAKGPRVVGNGHEVFFNNCDDILNVLENAPAGVYRLQAYGQEGDQIINPMDEFNKFELALPLTFDLSDPNHPIVRGLNKDGSDMVIEGKDKVYAKDFCQDVKNPNSPDDIIYTVVSGKGGGLEVVMQFILNICQKVIKAVISVVTAIVKTYAVIDTEDFNDPAVLNNWRFVRDTCNILFVLILLAIAFLNFFGEGIDAYTIKKLLPRFLIAIVLVNLSLLMCRLIIQFSNVLTNYFIDVLNEPAWQSIVTDQASAAAGQIAGEFGAAIVALIMAIFGLLAGLLLAFMLMFRVIVLWLLVMLSPLVFLLWVLPPTQTLFSKWWEQFIKYVFMGPVIVLILVLAKKVANTIGQDSGPAGNWVKLLFSSGVLIAAVAVPTMLGGMAMQKVAGAVKNIGKKAGGLAWGATGAKAAARAKEGYMARVGDKRGPIGWIPRTQRARAKARAETARTRAPIYEEMGWDKLEKKAQRGDSQAAKQLIREGQAHRLEGHYDKFKDPSVRKMAAEYDPISAFGKDTEALAEHLKTFDASHLSAEGTKRFLAQKDTLKDKNGNSVIGDHHIEAIATRGSQASINAMHQHYRTNSGQIPKANTTAGRALLHSALSSKDSTIASKFINDGMTKDEFEKFLAYSSPEQAADWARSDVLGQLNPEHQAVVAAWGKQNSGSIDGMINKGSISEDFAKKYLGK